jgi:4-hydroxy-tetrahydrodipicolinate synthase
MFHNLNLITALVTPFDEQNKIDIKSFTRLLEHQSKNGIFGLLVGGSTGEASNLTEDEYREIIRLCVAHNSENFVIAGVTSTSTEHSINLARMAEDLGANGLICAVPPYIKSSQDGLLQHFEKLHNSTNLPIMLYSVPSRTGTDFKYDTIEKLAQLPKIKAFKDAAGDLVRVLKLSLIFNPQEFAIFAGDDILSLAYSANGAIGCVSVISNAYPKKCLEIQNKLKVGDFKSAFEINKLLFPLIEGISIDPNPVGIKHLLHKIGIIDSDNLRLPLIKASLKSSQEILRILNKIGISI